MNIGHGNKGSGSRDALPFAAGVYRSDEEDDAPNEVDAIRVELRNEVRALRAFIARSTATQDISRELAAMRASIDALSPPAKKGDRLAAFLRDRGLEGTLANRIVGAARASSAESLTAKLAAGMAEVVPLSPWSHATSSRRIVALVGPSGVGKTTTGAKLATHARMLGKTVALVSCDGYRVGAVDQLERYADLLGTRCHVARSGPDLAGILEEEDADLVLVDTSGRPPSASAPEAALMARRKRGAPVSVDVILCMPASIRLADAERVARTFAPLSPTAACVTKLDETVAPSGLVYATAAAKVPLTLLCNGPRVPEDVTAATLDAVMSALCAGEETL